MPPRLEKLVIDGSSRHRLCKGFLLVDRHDRLIDASLSERVKTSVEQKLQERPVLADFTVNISPDHPAVLSLQTPFLSICTARQRRIFIVRLVHATSYLAQAAADFHCQLIAAGINPYQSEGADDPVALCADIHQIEVYDEGEAERIYNAYRQFLPELLSISSHSAVYGGETQKDFSLRMSVNPSSYLPCYISQFSVPYIEQLRHMIRRKYKIGDLSQMDVHPPLGEEAEILRQADYPLLQRSAAAVELRFIDAQSSFPFIRAQMILLQAIAMYARSLLRSGKRITPISDKVIDANKALVLQSGAEAVLQPDLGFEQEERNKTPSFHDQQKPTAATTALLIMINELLLPALRDLECEPGELYPILLGAELRRRGRRCFANYAEYQKYLCNAYAPAEFTNLLKKQSSQLLSSPDFDIISDYNRRLQHTVIQEIETNWSEKLSLYDWISEPATNPSGRTMDKDLPERKLE